MSTVVPFQKTWDLQRSAGEAFSAVRLLKADADRRWHTVLRIERGTFVATRTAGQAVALIEARLAELPRHVFLDGDWVLSIPTTVEDGFAIDISNFGGRVRCLFGELEEPFEGVAEALSWVERALSDTYRLRITVIGGQRREWYLEPVEAPGPSLAMGHASLFDLLRDKTEIVRRNRFAAEPAQARDPARAGQA